MLETRVGLYALSPDHKEQRLEELAVAHGQMHTLTTQGHINTPGFC